MSWNGSGTFNRLYSWVADKAAGLNISSTRMDADTNDITSNGFGNCLTRDGQGSASANQPMATFRHTAVGAAQARDEYARLDQVQDGVALNWTISAGTAGALAATYTPALTALVDGQLCFVRAAAANTTTTPTFSPNGLTARTITKFGGTALVVGDIPGNLYELILRYNLANTRWELLNPAPNGTAGTVAPTGQICDYIGATAPTGWVLAVGNSIGNVASNATERANPDTLPLFTLIYNSANVASGEGQLQDSTGANVARGASAAADFAANRRILTPNFSDRFSRGKSGTTVLGEIGGGAATLIQTDLPNVTLALTGNLTNGNVTIGNQSQFSGQTANAGGVSIWGQGANSLGFTGALVSTALTGVTASINTGVTQTNVAIVPKYLVQTKIIKL